MKKRGKLLGIVCIIAMVVGIVAAGCAAEAPPTEGPPTEGPPTEGPPPEEEIFELTVSTQHTMKSPFNRVLMVNWFKWLENESDGRLKMTLFHSETAAKAPDNYDAARTGVVDIACQALAFVPGRFPLTEVTILPLLFEFPGSRACGSTGLALYEKYPEIQAEYQDVVVLGFHSNGPSQISTTEVPVHTLEDMEGLVINAAGTWGARIMSALGATPEALLPGEMYDALAKGVIDGQALEFEGTYTWNIVDVARYTTECSLYISVPFVHVMNVDTYNSLPPDLQELFTARENMLLWMDVAGHEFDQEDIRCRDEEIEAVYLARGDPPIYVLPDEELARWIDAVMPVREMWVEEAAAIVGEANARAILDDAIMFGEQYAYTGFCQECQDTLDEWIALGE